jgi:hypothetical protein
MSEDAHKGRSKLKKFCALGANPNCKGDDPCTLSQTYVDACKGEAAGWSTFTFPQLNTRKETKEQYTTHRPFEAHHTLPCAIVSAELVAHSKVQEIATETQWCINKPENMIPLPLWGHTVRHYVYDNADNPMPPPFQNRPQHDWDHHAFNEEVRDVLATMREQLLEEKSEHKVAAQNLAGRLDVQCGKFKAKLHQRGSTRAGGTHLGWQARQGGPFSMAPDGQITKPPFPTKFDRRWKSAVDRLAKFFTGVA